MLCPPPPRTVQAGEGLELLPGIRELLEALAARRWGLGEGHGAA